jgi:PAS domain S-box-containing protein
VTGVWLLWAVAVALALGCAALWLANRGLRRRAEEAERRQRELVDGLADGVVLIDRAERIAFANPSAERILGAIPEGTELGRRQWTPLDPAGEPLAPGENPAAVTARTGEPCAGVELALRRSDGAVRWIAVSTHALRDGPDEGPPYPVVAAFTDITERRAAVEALERSNAELAQFAYVASHDLSEPLRMVSSYLQLLRRRYRGKLDEDADEFIDYAVDGANRMRALIEDLLAYSRAGRTAEPLPVDTGLVMADVLSSLAAAIADARARVEVGHLPIVQGDRLALVQLLQNLVANALKFRRGPGACVWIGAEEAPGSMWSFSIADDGIGIEPGHRDRVFKMFQRLHEREAYEGTGIGLAICRKIVERHGGQIWVDEREGGGTVFQFTLPAVAPPAAVEPAPDGERAAAPA